MAGKITLELCIIPGDQPSSLILELLREVDGIVVSACPIAIHTPTRKNQGHATMHRWCRRHVACMYLDMIILPSRCTKMNARDGDVPPCEATTPRFTSGSAKTASSLATTMSQFNTSSTPPPYADPLTAAMMGLQDVCRREMAAKPLRDEAVASCSVM